MVYKHAISTVVPARSVSHHNNNTQQGQHNQAQQTETPAAEPQAE